MEGCRVCGRAEGPSPPPRGRGSEGDRPVPHHHARGAEETARLHGLMEPHKLLAMATARPVLPPTEVDAPPSAPRTATSGEGRSRCGRTASGPRTVLPRPAHPDREVVFLFAGRGEHHRRALDLLREALRRLRRRGWRLEALVRLSEAPREALAVAFRDGIRIRGLVAEEAPERTCAEAHVAAMPTRCEALGMPSTEAMRRWLPVISTDVGGVPEVEPPGTGPLAPPQDEDARPEALWRLGGSREERRRLGVAGRRWVERSPWKHIVARRAAILPGR